MPTILRVGAYRFFFFSGDRGEPPHVHIERDDKIAKFWLHPVRLHNSGRFSRRAILSDALRVNANPFPTDLSRQEISRLGALVLEHQAQLLEAWNDYFHD